MAASKQELLLQRPSYQGCHHTLLWKPETLLLDQDSKVSFGRCGFRVQGKFERLVLLGCMVSFGD